ncbi:hypothetical protein AUC43_18405 [Hymenobacter sedentarius]|uniref:Uncharacterized protein n=1 Tax=Hymenobacter sedentarius TaxID=1411621 RepID=A0A0U4BJY9_9BACT|nr:hypothetical protein AUC43_18405 [Hymenobacter sedentarius]
MLGVADLCEVLGAAGLVVGLGPGSRGGASEEQGAGQNELREKVRHVGRGENKAAATGGNLAELVALREALRTYELAHPTEHGGGAPRRR